MKFYLIFVFLLSLIFIPQAHAETLKIGAKLQQYSKPQPIECDINVPKDYPTIQMGINASLDGETICVGKGSYNEDLLIDKEIKLSGSGYRLSKINGQNADTSGTVYITAKNAIVEGFYIQGIGVSRGSSAVRIFENVENTIVRFNYIVANNGQLAFLTDNAQQNNLIQDNVLKGNNSPDIAKVNAFDSNKPSSNVSFIRNTFLGTTSPTSFQTEVFVLDAGAPNSLIQGNIFDATGSMTGVVATNNSSEVHDNNFNSGALRKVSSTFGLPVNAENNWWGDLDPSDNIQGSVSFQPFAYEPFKEN